MDYVWLMQFLLFLLLLIPLTSYSTELFDVPASFSTIGQSGCVSLPLTNSPLASCNQCISAINTAGGHSLGCGAITGNSNRNTFVDCTGMFSDGGTNCSDIQTTHTCPTVGPNDSVVQNITQTNLNEDTCTYLGEPPVEDPMCEERTGENVSTAGEFTDCVDGCATTGVSVTLGGFTSSTLSGAACPTGDTDSPSDTDAPEPPNVPTPDLLDSLPPNGCISDGSGNTICTPDAPTPPAPDTGTPGEAASPDGTVNNNTTNTTNNFFNESTTNNSSTTSGTGQGDDGSGPGDSNNNPEDGVGTQDGDEDGEPDGCDPSQDPSCDDSFGDTSCDAPPECSGDPIQCGQALLLWERKCYVEASQEYLGRDNLHDPNNPLNQGGEDTETELDVGDLLTFDSSGLPSVGSGSCPAPLTINILGFPIEVSFQPFCDLAFFLSPLVIAFGFFVAGRIALGGL